LLYDIKAWFLCNECEFEGFLGVLDCLGKLVDSSSDEGESLADDEENDPVDSE